MILICLRVVCLIHILIALIQSLCKENFLLLMACAMILSVLIMLLIEVQRVFELPKLVPLMNSEEKLKFRKVPKVLQYSHPINTNFLNDMLIICLCYFTHFDHRKVV